MIENGDLHLYIIEIIGALMSFVFVWIKNIQINNDKMAEVRLQVANIVDQAVTETYVMYVRDLNKAASNGKLTGEEKHEARARAIASAKVGLRVAGIELVKIFGTDVIDYLIEISVNRLKGKPVEA